MLDGLVVVAAAAVLDDLLPSLAAAGPVAAGTALQGIAA